MECEECMETAAGKMYQLRSNVGGDSSRNMSTVQQSSNYGKKLFKLFDMNRIIWCKLYVTICEKNDSEKAIKEGYQESFKERSDKVRSQKEL